MSIKVTEPMRAAIRADQVDDPTSVAPLAELGIILVDRILQLVLDHNEQAAYALVDQALDHKDVAHPLIAMAIATLAVCERGLRSAQITVGHLDPDQLNQLRDAIARDMAVEDEL
jgi:hypothetical protein